MTHPTALIPMLLIALLAAAGGVGVTAEGSGPARKAIAEMHAAMNRGDAEAARQALERWLPRLEERAAGDPQATSTLLHLLVDFGRTAMAAGFPEEARTAFETVAARGEDSPWGRRAAGHLYELDHLGVGQPAPAFTTTLLDGSAISSRDLQGQVVVLDFWATWCGACMAARPTLRELATRHGGAELLLLGIPFDENRDTLESRMAEHGIDWPQVWTTAGPEQELPRAFNVEGPPVYWVLDGDGRIAGRMRHTDELIETVEALLSGSPSGRGR